ncbi:hypothetical protein QOT17_006412 [Balamuthia mandrillaris]
MQRPPPMGSVKLGSKVIVDELNKDGQKVITDEQEIAVYRNLRNYTVTKLLAQVEPHGSETAGWKLVKDERAILVSKKDCGDCFMTRVEGRVCATPQEIGTVLVNHDHDPLTMSLTEVARIEGEEMNITHLRSYSPSLLLSPRDFSLLRFVYFDEGSGRWIYAATSVQCPELVPPSVPGFVRGEILHSGWILEPLGVDKDQCFCTYVLNVDIKGWVPPFVVNAVRARQVYQTLVDLQACVELYRRQKRKGSQHQQSHPTHLLTRSSSGSSSPRSSSSSSATTPTRSASAPPAQTSRSPPRYRSGSVEPKVMEQTCPSTSPVRSRQNSDPYT